MSNQLKQTTLNNHLNPTTKDLRHGHLESVNMHKLTPNNNSTQPWLAATDFDYRLSRNDNGQQPDQELAFNHEELLNLAHKLSEIEAALSNKADKTQLAVDNLQNALASVTINDPSLAEFSKLITSKLDDFAANFYPTEQLSEVASSQYMQQQAEIAKHAVLGSFAKYADEHGFGSLTQDYHQNSGFGNTTDNTNSLIDRMLQTKQPNILFIAMLAFLGAADVDSQLILATGNQMMLNKNREKKLIDVQRALQSLSELLPYTDKNGKEITNMYDLFKLAFGNPSDPKAAKALGPLKELLKSIEDPNSTTTPKASYWDEIEKSGWPDGGSDSKVEKDLFTPMFKAFFNQLNQTLAQVGSEPMPDLTIKDGRIQVDSKVINDATSKAQEGATAAGSISQDQNVMMEANKQVFQTHFQAATSCLQLLNKLMDYLYNHI